MDPNSDTAQQPTNIGTEDMGASMSDAELEAFVDKTLGNKAPKATKTEDKKDELSKDDKPFATDDKKTAKDSAEVKPVDDKKDSEQKELVKAAEQPEEVKPVEIPAVDLSDLYVDVDVFVVDDKGENPKEETIRLNVGDSIPDNARFKNDKQLFDLLDAQREMKELRDARTAEYEDKKSQEDEKVSAEKAKTDQLNGWDAEINDLIEAGDMEAPKVKPGESGFLEDPTTVLIDKVFKFMTAENKKLIDAKKAPIRSFEVAFNRYNKQAKTQEKLDDDAKQTERLKQAGSLVGGGSNSGGSTGGNQKIYVAGSARSIYQVDTSDL